MHTASNTDLDDHCYLACCVPAKAERRASVGTVRCVVDLSAALWNIRMTSSILVFCCVVSHLDHEEHVPICDQSWQFQLETDGKSNGSASARTPTQPRLTAVASARHLDHRSHPHATESGNTKQSQTTHAARSSPPQRAERAAWVRRRSCPQRTRHDRALRLPPSNRCAAHRAHGAMAAAPLQHFCWRRRHGCVRRAAMRQAASGTFDGGGGTQETSTAEHERMDTRDTERAQARRRPPSDDARRFVLACV